MDRDFLVKHLKSFDVPVLNVTEEGGEVAEIPFELSREVQFSFSGSNIFHQFFLGTKRRSPEIGDPPKRIQSILVRYPSDHMSDPFPLTLFLPTMTQNLLHCGLHCPLMPPFS